MPLPVCETPELLLECDLLALMIRWRNNVQSRIEVDTTYAGVRAHLVLEPTTIPMIEIPDRMSPCETDVLELLRGCGKRLTKPEICECLEAAKKYHGERTVAVALGTLADRELIERPRPGSRDGYAIKV